MHRDEPMQIGEDAAFRTAAMNACPGNEAP
jgi:hypothetical protein